MRKVWLLALWATGAVAQASTGDLASVRQQFRKSLDAVATARAEQLQALGERYAKSLEELRKGATASGDLASVVAVKRELQRAGQWESPAPEDRRQFPPALQQSRQKFDSDFARIIADGLAKERPLRQAYARDLEELQRRLTTQDKIEEALAVKGERDRVLEGLQMTPPEPATTVTLPAQPPPAQPGRSLRIRTLIDEAAVVCWRGTRIWFEHRWGALPGRGLGGNEPTTIGTVQWTPTWRKLECMPYDRLITPLPSQEALNIQVKVKEGDGTITVIERPSRTNQYTLRALIEDYNGGANWYEFEIMW